MAKSLKIFMNIAKQNVGGLDKLRNKHEQYVEHYIKGSNDALYILLAELLEECIKINALPNAASVLEGMRGLLREKGLKLQKKSKPTNIVVRYVVGTNRKTAHTYGRVMDIAMQDEISPANLPSYIKEKGGIDKVRQSLAKAVEQQVHKERIEISNSAMLAELKTRQSLGEITLNPALEAKLPGAADVQFTYLMCAKNAVTGKLEVVATLYPSLDIEKEALELQVTTAMVAAQADENTFYSSCKDNGLNMDQVHNWMSSNGLKNGADAAALLSALKARCKSHPKPQYDVMVNVAEIDSASVT